MARIRIADLVVDEALDHKALTWVRGGSALSPPGALANACRPSLFSAALAPKSVRDSRDFTGERRT